MMKKCIFYSLVLLLSVSIAFSQKLKSKTIVIENKISLVIPASFREPAIMSPTGTNANANSKLLLNEQESIRLSYQLGDTSNLTAVEMGDNDVHEWADKQLAILKTQPNFLYLDDGVFLQAGKNIGYIKFIMKQPGSKTYHLLFFTSVDNKLAQFTFSCPAKLRKKWEPIADAIANSIRLTDSETN